MYAIRSYYGVGNWDFDASKAVTWSVSGSDSAAFQISSSGVLRFKNAPDYEVDQHDYTLNVNATVITSYSIHYTKLYEMLPEGIERFVTLGGEPQIDWRAELHHALDRHFRSDYRSMPPSKKLLYRGIYLPSLYGESYNFV